MGGAPIVAAIQFDCLSGLRSGFNAMKFRKSFGGLASRKRRRDWNRLYACLVGTRGVCLFITGRFDEAGTLIRRAADLDPLAPHYQMDLGMLLRVQGRHDESIEQLQAALEIDPNHREPLWQLGLALQQAGRFDEAPASFGRATIDPIGELRALDTAGHCYAAAGRPEVAKAMLERLESAQVRAPGNDLSRLVAKLHQGFAAQAGGDGLRTDSQKQAVHRSFPLYRNREGGAKA